MIHFTYPEPTDGSIFTADTAMNPLNVRIIPTAYGDLPPNWAEQVDGRMHYIEEGENIIVERESLSGAAPAFLDSEVGQQLCAWFNANPTFGQLILQPR